MNTLSLGTILPSDNTTAAATSRLLDPRRTGNAANSLYDRLSKLVIGQNEAVEQIVNIYNMHSVGLTAPGRPIGSFLFLGPTGSGKTRTVEATAEALVGNPRALVKIDCAEFQHSHEIAKLIGSPPGYLGHRETHPLLSQEVLNQHHTDKVKISFVLFDEIEKASDSLWNLLLGILDKATLTLGNNVKVDFSRAMIFMTSNLGVTEMNNLVKTRFGFAAAAPPATADQAQADIKRKVVGIEAARRKFSPEFMNRLDKVIVFKALEEKELQQIFELELSMVRKRILAPDSPVKYTLRLTNEARQFLLQQGFDIKYGARHLKRAIERELVHPLSNLMATGQIETGDQIEAGFDQTEQTLTFTKGLFKVSVENMSA